MPEPDPYFKPLDRCAWSATWPGMIFTQAGEVAALRLGETLRTIVSHPVPGARYLLTFVLIDALLASHWDDGVHCAVDEVWEWIVADNYWEIEANVAPDGRILGFDSPSGDLGDWEASATSAVLRADAGQRAVALGDVLEDVMEHRRKMTLATRKKLADG